MENKTTLKIYKTYKLEVQEESWFDNTIGSKLLMNARTNTLQLHWRKRLQNEDDKCPCCQQTTETLEHFLLHCEKLSDIRQKYSMTSQPYPINTDNTIANIILLHKDKKINKEDITIRKNYLKEIWNKRNKIIKELTLDQATRN